MVLGLWLPENCCHRPRCHWSAPMSRPDIGVRASLNRHKRCNHLSLQAAVYPGPYPRPTFTFRGPSGAGQDRRRFRYPASLGYLPTVVRLDAAVPVSLPLITPVTDQHELNRPGVAVSAGLRMLLAITLKTVQMPPPKPLGNWPIVTASTKKQ